MNSGIVAGIDGSAAGGEAAGWAAREALLRGLSLRLVHAIPRWAHEMRVDAPRAEVGRWMRKSAADLVERAVEDARRTIGDVSGDVVPGDPREALLEETRQARMLVVGGHGLGGFRGMLLGSVSLGVSGRAACPVVIVRLAPAEERGEIVVGVDGSPESDAAIGLAFEEASLRRARVRAIHADPDPGEESRRLLTESLTSWTERHPGVTVVDEVVRVHPAQALRTASDGADLLVVGSRGRGLIKGLVLGSVSHAIVHHARCPVAVVHA